MVTSSEKTGFTKNLSTMEVENAAGILRSGGLVAFPTESFYGLGADAANETALQRLYFTKERKPGKPVLLLLPGSEGVMHYAAEVSESALRLMNTFWPGGLTLVFKAQKNVSKLLTAGTGKIGVRVSSHPLAKALTQAFGAAITGTSANISGALPCNTAGEVSEALGERVDIILDGGRTAGGKPSTVLDVTTVPPAILREGLISGEMLKPYIKAFC